MKIEEILIKPILTEKTNKLAGDKVYTFQVNQRANKYQAKEAIEKLYGVKVTKVRVLMKKGKTRKVGRRMKAKGLADKKICFFKLKEGKIDLFPQS